MDDNPTTQLVDEETAVRAKTVLEAPVSPTVEDAIAAAMGPAGVSELVEPDPKLAPTPESP